MTRSSRALLHRWFLLCVLLVVTVLGDKLYVSSAGRDTDNGSEETPWATPEYAAQQAGPGDTVFIMEGTYIPSDQIVFANSGTIAQPILFRNHDTDSVVIDAQGGIPTWDWNAVVDVDGNDFITIEGLTVINSHWFGFGVYNADSVVLRNNNTYNTGGSGIYCRNSTRLRIEGNRVRKAVQSTNTGGAGQECISVSLSHSFEICHNEVWDRPVETGTNGGEGIDAKEGSSHGSIHHNRIHDLARLGLYIDGGYSRDTSGTIDVYANEVYNCRSGIIVGVETDSGYLRDVRVFNNLVYNNALRGFSVAGYMDNGPVNGVQVINNTFYSNGNTGGNDWEGNGILIEGDNPDNGNMVIRNNILSGNNNQIRTKDQPYLVIDHNLFDGPTLTSGDNAVIGNPLFATPDEGDFHLQEGSPAIDSGSTDDAPGEDVEGTSRPQGDAPDIGAYEYLPTTAARRRDTPGRSRGAVLQVAPRATILFDCLGRAVSPEASPTGLVVTGTATLKARVVETGSHSSMRVKDESGGR